MYGPIVAQFLDKEIDKYQNSLESTRTGQIDAYKELIANEKKEQYCVEGQKIIMDIKKENVKMQLEATYRERMMKIYQEV